jgi:uncharacterized protein YndB with AHSA1/START domain
MTNTNVDRSTNTITFERRLRAAREDVFDAWTRPADLAAWWDPTGAPLSKCEVDARPGGAFRFENQGHSPPFTGVYQVVDRPGKIVFEAMGAVGTVSLEADGEATRMRVTIRCASAEHLDQFVKLGVAVNTERTLDNLVAHVAKRAA